MDSNEKKIEYIKELKSLLSNMNEIIALIEAEGVMFGDIPINGDSFIPEHQVCRFLYISQKTMRRLRQKFKIPFFKNGRVIVYRLKDIQYAIDNGIIINTNKSIEDIIIGYARYVRQRDATPANK